MSATSLNTSDPDLQSRPRVLVADDSRVIRMAIKRILGADYDLVEVGDGASAWDCVREDAKILALVTDIEMPNVDGYELICRIRGAEDSRLRELPVIAITGADDEATKQRAFACGATDFIIKPIDAIQLKARVQAYVRYDQAVREQVQKTTILEDQVIMDSMTGLCTRRYLNQRGGEQLAYSIRHGGDLSLIRIDIDHFKKLYKTHGDDISEDLLVWFAKVLAGCARTEDTVARIGGAEFAILAGATSIANAAAVCLRLREALAKQPYRHGNITIPITLSMGMSSLMQDRRDNIGDLIKLAHQRLCHAQSEGGDRVCSSVLDDLPIIEEVLAPPAPEQASIDPSTSVSDAAASQEVEWTLDLGEITEPAAELYEEVSLSSLDPVVDTGSVDSSAVMNLAGLKEPIGQASDLKIPSEPMSVDSALLLLAQGRADLLATHLEALMEKIQPLMELSTQIARKKSGK